MSDRPANRPRKLQSLGGTQQAPPPDPAPPRPSESLNTWYPAPLSKVEDTGLSHINISELVLKVLYYNGDMLGRDIADVIKLPFTGVLDGVMEWLRREKYVEVRGSAGVGDSKLRFMIAGRGIEKAQEALARSQYAGAAPVSLKHYVESMHKQNTSRPPVQQPQLRGLMDNLVISDDMLSLIGPAVNSGRSIFLYGPPGNGKTTIAERVGRMILGEDLWVPYAIDVDGQVIQIFDSVNHELSDNPPKLNLGTGTVPDPRWVCIKRPMIMVGGELTLSGLDLVYNEVNKFYEAPFQVKANGGMFLIDDFGRQQVRAVDLLNRWIVPLEKGVDFLTLNNGRKIEVPFFVLIVFSTNLDPKDLVDEAFLRRIRHKIEVGNPTYEQFREIFKIMCRVKKVPYDEQGLAYLLKEWYINQDRDLRSVHPRDLLSQMIDIAGYLDVPPSMGNRELIDRAAASYFVEL
jgi:predicted ATPase with chaperone activity